MTDLVEFLRARLDEDEHVAREAAPGPWVVIPDRDDFNFTITGKGHTVVTSNDDGGIYEKRDAAHIARHDPARVLAEVEAKRRIMARHCRDPFWADSPLLRNSCGGCGVEGPMESPRADVDECPELRDLAAIYAGHPDYRQKWAV